MQTTCKVVNYCLYRHFSVSNKVNKGYINRESKFLTKILQKDAKSVHNPDPFAIPLLKPGYPSKIRHEQSKKRISVLNKIITGYITDLISTGDAASRLLEEEVQIHEIEVASTANVIRIYWSHYAMNVDSISKELDEMMLKAGNELRNKLSQLNVIGMVPPVVFVKHKYAMVQKEVESRLNSIDYGPDYETQTYKRFGTKTVTDEPSCEGDEEDFNECDDTKFSITLPVMQHCVMGVDHYKIMSKIKAAMEKSRKMAKQRKLQAERAHEIHSKRPANYSKILEQQHNHQEQFLNYITKLKKEQRIKRKPSKKFEPYTEFAEDEYTESENPQDDYLIEEDTFFDDDPEEL